MLRFSITTLGCKVNQYDGQAIAAALAAEGLRPCEPLGDRGFAADLVVINTCCVTATAMQKSRQAIRRAVRGAPGAFVLVAGCYADYDPARISDLLAGLGLAPQRVVVAGHHHDLAESIRRLVSGIKACRNLQPSRGPEGPAALVCPGLPERPAHPPAPLGAQIQQAGDDVGWDDLCMNADTAACPTTMASIIKARRQAAVKNNVAGMQGMGPISRFLGHQRAFVKVQDGCDAFCAYCIVPYTRCRVWSRTQQEVQQEVRALVAAGHKEIVLSGVFLGAYGRPTAIRRRWRGAESCGGGLRGRASPLAALLRRLASIEGLWRLRLSSLEPADLTDDLLAACATLPTVAPHFHLPLQSGSQRILRRMNRQYSMDEYRHTVDRLRETLDRPALTTDVIVGFPGETDEDFDATLEAARYAGFAKIHAFPFSPIQGTAAWNWRAEAPAAAVVKDRMARLAHLERQLAAGYRRQFVGQTMEGLVEALDSRNPLRRRAMTDRHITAFFDGANVPAGTVVKLTITGLRDDGVDARVMGSKAGA